MNEFLTTLQKYWGYDAFRLGQAAIVEDVFNGHDVLALMPTGGGKSICFQVPGLMRKGITVVISPLIALMQDQVNALQAKNIPSVAITSGMSFRELDIVLDNAKFGAYQFLYTSPERIQSRLFIERFKQMNVALIVVDEAHCISEWGHDFRPSFMDVKKLRDHHPNVPIIALTATATKQTQEEIVERLVLRSPKVHQSPFERPNLIYQSVRSENKLQDVLDLCNKNQQQTGIVYCQTRKSVKFITAILTKNNISAGMYHGGMNKDERKNMLNAWLTDRIRVMVATNAFGMGIDKPDVRFVVHYEFPNSLEAYFQEAGRGGRDGERSIAVNYWQQEDIENLYHQLEQKYLPIEEVKRVYRALCNYLKVAIGSGKGETYNFDLLTFCKTFDISTVVCYNALKALESVQQIAFAETVFHATKVKFAVGHTALYNFQIQHERVYPLTVMLVRTYPGIFDNFFEIDERELSQRLKITLQELDHQLNYLEKSGIIDVDWKSDTPTITFLQPRMPYDYIEINPTTYSLRKQIASDKLKAVHNYLTTSDCRALLLINYFGIASKPCGKCDNCLKVTTTKRIENDTAMIMQALAQYPHTNAELKALIDDANNYKQIIRSLVQDEKILFDGKSFKIVDAK